MTVFAGEVECELTIRYGNNRISTINFILDVERAALQDDVVISETDLPILQQIPEYAAQASADADRAEQAAATAMSTDAGKVTDRLNLNNTRNLVVPADINYTQNGVTMKTNADGSITLSGAETSGQSYTTTIIFPNFATTESIGDTPMGILPSGKYRLWGDTVGGRIQGKAFLAAYKYDANKVLTNIGNNGNGNNRDFELTDAYPYFNLGLVIKGNADFGNGMTIYPMITTQSTTDVTGYEQGALSNRALTIKSEILDDLDCGEDSLMNEGIRYPVINGIRNYTDSNGVYHKNLGCVDLGTLTWSASSTSTSGVSRFTTYLPSAQYIKPKRSDTTNGVTSICHKMSVLESAGTFGGTKDGYTIADTGDIFVYMSAYKTSTAAAFKSAMSGVLLFYELITPQTWNTKSIVGLDALATTNKTLIGAINELKARIDAL
jgi:hypothetical protein